MRRYSASLANHIEKLSNDHKTLDKDIERLENGGNFDDIELQALKKKKLQLKDAIARLKSQKDRADEITRSVRR